MQTREIQQRRKYIDGQELLVCFSQRNTPFCPLSHSGDGFLAVYSVTDHGTLTELQQQYQDLLLERNGIPSPTVLVGNKTDLGCGDDDTGVPSNLGERVAQEYFGAGMLAPVNI